MVSWYQILARLGIILNFSLCFFSDIRNNLFEMIVQISISENQKKNSFTAVKRIPVVYISLKFVRRLIPESPMNNDRITSIAQNIAKYFIATLEF